MEMMVDSGCVFDGALGFEYNARRIIELANEYGAQLDSNVEGEWLVDESDIAINYLNDQSPTDMLFGWNDGDFIYMSALNWAEE